jgi:hypothetical protein
MSDPPGPGVWGGGCMHIDSRGRRCEGETWQTIEMYVFRRIYLDQNARKPI